MKAIGLRRSAPIVAILIVAVLLFSLGAPQRAIGEASGAPLHVTGPSSSGDTQVASSGPRPDSGVHSPHPGTLDVYESEGDGTTVDPSAAYYTVNAEPIWNVYETLIAYNGSDTGPAPSNFVPQGATCVPGSTECLAQFGSDLVYPNATGAPTYYTFEIDGQARFYDPATSVSWPVYPSDVVFSLARTLAFADYPGFGVYNGWINAQDVLPTGNGNWDNGLHAPYNNTPNHILSAFLVNDSSYCPTSTEVLSNGCVTWNVSASGTSWPYLLELISDPMGASIQSCGWATYEEGGANLGAPDFAGTTAANGDGPCTLPGGYTSSTQSISGVSYGQYIDSLGPTSWDAYELLGINYPSPQANLQWNMVGSGPYYNLNPVNPSSGYFLRANPAYAAPQGCAGQIGCLPLPGHYEGTVNVYWSPNDTAGLEEMAAGWADTAQFYPTSIEPVEAIIANGTYHLMTDIPTLSIYFDPFDLNFSLTALATIDTHGGTNVPGTFLSNVGLREFLVNAFPYATDEATIQTIDGVEFGEHYGGMIPIGMGNYYPTNISWPGGNPVSNPSTPGNVSWWWTQLTTSSSPWYDPTFAACTSSSPCKFPFVSLTVSPTVTASMQNWAGEIDNLTGGAVVPYVIQLNIGTLVADQPGQETCGSVTVGYGPGEGCEPVYSYGWAPDYPDPTDYVSPTYYPNATYTYVDAVDQQLVGQPAYNNPTACGHTTIDPSTSNYSSAWANLTYWADGGGGSDGVGVADQCQGIAYTAMVDFMEYAGPLTNLEQRALIYNVAEHIADELALYMYWDQGLGAVTYANWIAPTSVNTNAMIGGGGDQLWYAWRYVSPTFNATFVETGLPVGTPWSVSIAGVGTLNSTSDLLLVEGLPNGTYSYTVPSIPGYVASPSQGTFAVEGGSTTVELSWNLARGHYAVTFVEGGLPPGTEWAINLNGTTMTSTQPFLNAILQNGSYSWSDNLSVLWDALPLWYATPGSGFVNVSGASPPAVALEFRPSGPPPTTWPAVFTLRGVTVPGWDLSINGDSYPESSNTATIDLPLGTYSWGVTVPTGYYATPSGGNLNVTAEGASQTITIAQTSAPSPCCGIAPTPAFGTLALVVIGALVLVLVGTVLALVWAGRRRPPENLSPSSGPARMPSAEDGPGANK